MITVKLKTPVTVGSNTVTELQFRRPKAKDFDGIELKISGGGIVLDFTSIKRLAGRICGQTDAVMGEIDIADFSEVASVVMGFIGDSLQIGGT